MCTLSYKCVKNGRKGSNNNIPTRIIGPTIYCPSICWQVNTSGQELPPFQLSVDRAEQWRRKSLWPTVRASNSTAFVWCSWGTTRGWQSQIKISPRYVVVAEVHWTEPLDVMTPIRLIVLLLRRVQRLRGMHKQRNRSLASIRVPRNGVEPKTTRDRCLSMNQMTSRWRTSISACH